jgi:hypothetical protein
LGGNHRLLLYSIVYSSPWGPHPNGFLSWDSQVGVSKFPQLGLPQLRGRITSCADLQLQWGLKKSYTPCREISNGMLHIACTSRNRVDSRLLMVGSQTTSLTFGLPFGHNLCFRCPNGQCKPILDIYVSINFQWYKRLFKVMGFDCYNCTLKIRESIWDSNSQHGSSLGSVRVHSLTLFALLGTCDATLGSFSWPVTLHPLAVVASPRLRLRHLGSVNSYLGKFPNFNFFFFWWVESGSLTTKKELWHVIEPKIDAFNIIIIIVKIQPKDIRFFLLWDICGGWWEFYGSWCFLVHGC